jgi:hypothetical protein
MRPDELERRLQDRLDALGPAPRAELLHVLMLPDFEQAAVSDRANPERGLSRIDGGQETAGASLGPPCLSRKS